MEENTTTYEETLENNEESISDALPNDGVPSPTENSTEDGEGSALDNPQHDSGIHETVEETTEENVAESEETDTTEETEELEEIEAELSVEELVSGNDLPQSVVYMMNAETQTEEAVLFLEKPIAEYTTTEGLLLLIFILAFVGLCYKIIFE